MVKAQLACREDNLMDSWHKYMVLECAYLLRQVTSQNLQESINNVKSLDN